MKTIRNGARDAGRQDVAKAWQRVAKRSSWWSIWEGVFVSVVQVKWSAVEISRCGCNFGRGCKAKTKKKACTMSAEHGQ